MFPTSSTRRSRRAGSLGPHPRFRRATTVTQRREALAAAAVLGEGKLKELADLTGAKGWSLQALPSANPKRGRASKRARLTPRDAATKAVRTTAKTTRRGRRKRRDTDESEDETRKASVVVVDHEISPSQARNLERATGAQVLDRTGVIVEIFHRHAHSREARLQVEIARLKYVAPRLRESPAARRAPARAGARANRRSSSIGARSATASPSCAKSCAAIQKRSEASAATRAAISCASRWSATPTPASRR